MAKFHLHSVVNQSATRATVYLNTATGEHNFANVCRRDGFWQVIGLSGSRLLPLMPHTQIHKGEQVDTPMGVVLKLLREKLAAFYGAPVTNSVTTATTQLAA